MRIQSIIFFMPVLILTGCATPYQKLGSRGGYCDYKLDDRHYCVGFRGNGYTTNDRTFEYTLVRAAEVVLENGYNYFTVSNQANKSYSVTSAYSSANSGIPIVTTSDFPGVVLHVIGYEDYPEGKLAYDAREIIETHKG